MNVYEEKTIKFLIGKTIKDVEINGFCFNITFTDNSKIDYDATSKICNKYEYDESGLMKIYGCCCATCVNSNRKECPKTKG